MKNEIEYAGQRERFLALLVDALLFWGCSFPITRIVKGVWLMSPNDHAWVRSLFIFGPLCPAFLVLMVLYLVCLKGWLGATLGTWVFGLHLIGLEGSRAGLWTGALRNILPLVDGLAAFEHLGVTFIQGSEDRGRFGDRIAGTKVIRLSYHSPLAPGLSARVLASTGGGGRENANAQPINHNGEDTRQNTCRCPAQGSRTAVLH